MSDDKKPVKVKLSEKAAKGFKAFLGEAHGTKMYYDDPSRAFQQGYLAGFERAKALYVDFGTRSPTLSDKEKAALPHIGEGT